MHQRDEDRETIAELRAEVERLRELARIGVELDNHHNAAVCPYCTHARSGQPVSPPEGLPSPAATTGEAARGLSPDEMADRADKARADAARPAPVSGETALPVTMLRPVGCICGGEDGPCTCEASSGEAGGEHVPERVVTIDGWIQCVHCSCSDTHRPTTHEWALNHHAGPFEEGWQILSDLLERQKRSSVGKQPSTATPSLHIETPRPAPVVTPNADERTRS